MQHLVHGCRMRAEFAVVHDQCMIVHGHACIVMCSYIDVHVHYIVDVRMIRLHVIMHWLSIKISPIKIL